MSGRIEKAFARLKQEARKGLVTFIMGGDPDIATARTLLQGLPAAGADMIEIGMPFSDPMADGAVIEAAGLRALANGAKLKDIIALVADFRIGNADTPVILMGYYNPVYHYGIQKFCADAEGAGVDGVILVDLPPEEEEEFVSVALPFGIPLIRLITPTTDDARLARLMQNAGSFIYYIAVAGITGTKSADNTALKARVEHLKAQTSLPVAVGFGIKTPLQAAEVAKFSDAVVVGSALVDIAARQSPQKALEFVKQLRLEMDQ